MYGWLPLPPISSHVIICHAWANYLSGIMYTAGMAVSVCHASEVCTGRFCLCLLENIPDIWDVSALLSAVDVTPV